MFQPSSQQPQSVDLQLAPGAASTLYIWARPQTVIRDLAYHPQSNPFRQLVSLSLNIEGNPSNAAITGALIHNPAGARFDQVVDSGAGHQVTLTNQSGETTVYPLLSGAGIKGLVAYSLAVTPESGIGPNCQPGGGCALGPGGPSWLVGTVELSAQAIGQTAFHLQLGQAGIGHADELLPPNDYVVFGADDGVNGTGGRNWYNATLERQVTLPWDFPDAIVRVVSGAQTTGDYNRDGSVDAADYVVWRNTAGQIGDNLPADGDGNRVVDPGDYHVWRAHFGQRAVGAAVGGNAVPAPSGLILLLWAATFACGWRCRVMTVGRTP